MTTQLERPHDFDWYWQQVLEELAQYPPRPEVEMVPLRCTDFATMYGVRLTSIGPYRLFAYLSLPKEEAAAPFPTVFYFPGYSSVDNPIPQGATHELRRSRDRRADGAGNTDLPDSRQAEGQAFCLPLCLPLCGHLPVPR